MEKVLIVEDASIWQDILTEDLEKIVKREDIVVAGTYEEAVTMLNSNYAVYVLDMSFPRHRGGFSEPLGVQLAKEIHKRGVEYDRIFAISLSSEKLNKAREAGITKTYRKGNNDLKEGEKEIYRLAEDVGTLLNQQRT